ncbi:MAG: hypothetical protein LUI39_06670 [Lachnospiraceae bacterium]|nr:hypothetical protein [Lachnospiraceae bacterium]
MMDLYNQDRILEIHIASEKKIAAEEAEKRAENRAEEEREATIERMLKDGSLAVDKIASFVSVPVQKVREIEAGMQKDGRYARKE